MVRTVFYDPNGALSRARDFLSVRKVESAVDVLQSFLNTMAKRNRPWDKMHEVVIHKCIDLCVRLGAANRAKDSLHQYRAICQQIAPNSLLNAVNYLIDSSRKKLAAAEQKFEAQKKLNAVRKLDKHSAVTTILSGVSLDSADDRLRHELVQPWVTFLRDNFRACLDLLRNLNQLQVQYHQIAASAFEFCVQYPHPKEFRILCDSIRRHYTQIQELNAKPESALLMWEKKHKENGVVMDQNFIERQLVTRFTQMEYAAKMNQWAEVWHTIKGVHDIIATAPREQRPSIRAEFYLKVSRVFQQAGNPLFRAYALARYYSLSKSYNETLSQSQLVEISSTVLLSTISITTAPKNVVYGVEKLHDKNQAIAVQLDFDPEPSRDALLADILQMGVLEDVAPPVRELYLCLEEEFTPLQLIDRFVAALDAIKSARKGRLANAIMLKSYHHDLEVLAVIRLLEHLSSVYDKFSIENFQALIAKAGISFAQVETIIARQCAEVSTSVNVQIDHRNGTLNFHSGGPEGERIHAQLSTLAARLHSVVQEIESPESKGARANLKADFFNRIRDALPNENARMQLRPDVIEKLKVAKEEQRYIEQVRKNADAAAAAEENAARIAASLAEQQRKREERREAIAEMEERRQQVKAYAVEKLGLEEARILVASLGNNLSEAEVDEAMLEVQKKKQKEEEVAAKKRRALRRHLDYTTRALREAQIPRVKAHYQKVAEENLRTAKEAISKEYVSRRKFWEEMHGRKQEILHIVDGVRAFHNELMQTRQAELQKQRRETNHRIRAQARMQRAIDEQAQRRRMKQLEAEAAEEEARQRAAFEAEEAQREAEEAAHREELARREAEEQAAARQANKYVPPTRRGQNPPQDNRGFGGSSGGRFGGEGGRFGDSRGFGGDSRGFGGERRGFGGDNRDSRGFGGSGSSRGQGRW